MFWITVAISFAPFDNMAAPGDHIITFDMVFGNIILEILISQPHDWDKAELIWRGMKKRYILLLAYAGGD